MKKSKSKKELKDSLIKIRVQRCYKQIKEAEKELEKLRNQCSHSDVEEVDYMWRIGAYTKAKVCKYCGEVISTAFSEAFKNMNPEFTQDPSIIVK